MCLLELLTGRNPFEHDLRELVHSHIAADGGESIAEWLDPRIDNQDASYSAEKALLLAGLALRCLEHDVNTRSTIAEVLPAIENVLE
jgi:hypothetical protein